jgi:23S rRNA (pseudouridine1915-N3)-methyltransferase
MKITLIKIGRIAYPECRALGQVYQKRLHPKSAFEFLELKDDDHAVKFLGTKPPSGHVVWIFDEKGKEVDSRTFSQEIVTQRNLATTKHLSMIIGHPLGLPASIRSRAGACFSLSRLTLTSDLAHVILCEQVYRAFEIIKGTGYHHV